ncbi:MAG: LamG domain-containing protein [Pirellulaceae bacterium]
MNGLLAVCVFVSSLADAPVADLWEREYASDDCQSPHVIAVWQFNAGAELADSSGHGHSLELCGAKLTDAGRFGGGLQSFPGWPVEDVRHAAVAAAHPDLSPGGAFTIDMWLKPATNLPAEGNYHLLCKKYVSHHDYQLLLTVAEQGRRRLHLILGFGEDSESFFSESAEWPADQWQHIAATYDGAGTVAFYRNGESLGGRTAAARGAISPGPLPLSIGERTGSLYSGFAGVLDQVRLSRGVREFGRVRLELELERRVFVRCEPQPKAVIRVTNLRSDPLPQLRLSTSLSGYSGQEYVLADLRTGEPQLVEMLLDTRLRPDQYELRVDAVIPGDPQATTPAAPYRLSRNYPLRIVARPLPDRMPVVQWGVGGVSNIVKELPRLKQIGFTHCLGLDVDEHAIWQEKRPQETFRDDRRREVAAVLDTALADDLRVLISLSPGHGLHGMTQEFGRVDRSGQPVPQAGINGWYEPVQKFCEDVGYSAGRLYGRFPAFDGALIHSEVRDAATLSFSDVDRQAYRRATGADIPAEATAKWGLDRQALPTFPADGVIPDDDPLYRYFQWFWREGDAWPLLNSVTARGLQRGAENRTDLWTFHDPAVRVASVFGSGGDVDVLSQWTYSYPEPLRIGLPTDELLAMARGAQRTPRVMKMTQLIWYRSQTAPAAQGGQPTIRSPWDDHDPDAAYITIAPMHLREAFWTKLSRPIQGIMYHGWQSLVPSDEPTVYRYTHPETQHELQRLIRDIIEPFGPMLRRAPAARHDVAFYESFAAQMFAQRGAYGWSHTWTGDCYQVLQHAGLQADVLYDESITRFGLDGYRVLVIPDGDVLTRSVADRIGDFQKRGGILVADDRLASAIQPDIRLTPLVRTQQADVDKAGLLQLAATLKQDLVGKYVWPAESSNLDVVVHRRVFSSPEQGPASDAGAPPTGTYLFLVNDRREFGQYVGQHGLVQEVGRMSDATVTLRGQSPGSAVYDVLAHRRIDVVQEDGAPANSATLAWPVTVGPCDGRIFLAVPRAIASLSATLPDTTACGSSAECVIEVHDDRGTLIPAVLPLHVELRDPDGRPAEFSGHYAAVGGRLKLVWDLAANDVTGPWHLRVCDLVSGLSLDRELIVTANVAAASVESQRVP